MTVLFDDVELMQSTGLVDKNGQEIFEGDIVHAYSEDARLIGAIEYFDNAYCIKTKNGVYNSLWINAEYYEVIGNIYENPELLFKNLPEDDRQLTDFPTCPVCDERTYSEDTCPFWSSEWSVDKALNGGLL